MSWCISVHGVYQFHGIEKQLFIRNYAVENRGILRCNTYLRLFKFILNCKSTLVVRLLSLHLVFLCVFELVCAARDPMCVVGVHYMAEETRPWAMTEFEYELILASVK